MSAVPGDDRVPNVARIYDYLLGGSHNFAADRERADALIATGPSIVATARANRNFLRHAVERAMDRGVRQFLDLGSGIPTVGNVHEVAHRRDPDVRVAYVDHEAVAVAHSAAILADVDQATITDADYRDPATVLVAPGVAGLLDLDRPVALLAVTALHFVHDEDDPTAMIKTYRRALASGSVLALSHGSDDYPEHPAFLAKHLAATRLYATTSNPIRLRSRAEILALMAAADFVPDRSGLVDIGHWAAPAHDEPLGAYAVISEPLR